VLFGPVHEPVWQTRSAHAPQSIVCPQLLVTLPHFGDAVPTAQVVSRLSGVQHTPWARLQTQFGRSGHGAVVLHAPVHVVGTHC
jgi:hypothetical protein